MASASGSSTRKQLAWELVIWGLGFAIVLMVIVGVRAAWQRFHRTDEQVELEQYVKLQVPSLMEGERDVLTRLAPLSSRPGPGPESARALLVEDVVPRLIQLRKRAQTVEAHTADVRVLVADYLVWVDRLIDACRARVRAIDDTPGKRGIAEDGDPRVAGAAALVEVRARFATADAAADAWMSHVKAACERQHLVAPRQVSNQAGR